MARLVPVSRCSPSSVSRKRPSASTRRDDHQEIVAAEREHGIDQIVPCALIAEIDLQTVGEESEKIPRDLVLLLLVARQVRAKLLEERQAHAVLEHDADDAERGAAERIRVLGARGLLVDGPEARERVELVGKSDGNGDRLARHLVGRPDRLVMGGDGVGDGRILFLLERVVVAHHALQLGELADHVGEQVGLGEDGRALGEIGIGADQRRDLPGQMKDTLHPLVLAAELLVEGDLLQLRHAVFERHLAVLVEEELGVGEPSCDDALIAGGDGLAAVLRLQVGDDDESVGELVALLEREGFLVRLHGGGEHLRRHAQEILVESCP